MSFLGSFLQNQIRKKISQKYIKSKVNAVDKSRVESNFFFAFKTPVSGIVTLCLLTWRHSSAGDDIKTLSFAGTGVETSEVGSVMTCPCPPMIFISATVDFFCML